MGFTRGSRVRDALLDSVEEHAKLFAAERSDLKPDEVHEALAAAVERGLLEFDIPRIHKPEVREGERIQDDPLLSPEHQGVLLRSLDIRTPVEVEAAADRVLDKVRPWDGAD